MRSIINKAGLVCEWSEELEKDMLAVHGFDIKTVFQTSYGTSFSIDKHYERDLGLLFVLTTNDPRDNPRSWYVKTP
jgi:hypothetical protein